MATVVVDLADSRPIWALPARMRSRIRSSVPDSWSVAFMDTPADGSGDGVQRAPAALLEAVADARVYLGYGIPGEVLTAAPRLEWAHSAAAGVASSLGPEMLASDVLFTNSAGIHAPPMAETVLAMMLHFARGLDLATRAQAREEWAAPCYWAADAPVREVAGATVGVIGYGGIGRAVAAAATCLGCCVRAVRRRPPPAPESDCAGVELMFGEEGLDRLVRASDYLVLAVPETRATRGMMDPARIRSMKPGSVLINVARGGLVDEEALLATLDSGRLRGAALDVFSREPLPAGHPFYRHPRILMTPHVSATSRGFWGREGALIMENLTRFAQGRPLRNVVDKAAGY